LPDHLPDYQEKSKHEVFKKYIRPLSEFVQDINKEING